MGKSVKILVIAGILIILIGGGILAWQYFTAPKAQIQNLKIIPSQETAEGIVYSEGARAVVMGENLAKVEFRQRGGGQIYTDPEGGLIGNGIMVETKNGEERWESALPTERLMNEFCAVGFDRKGDKIGEVCIFNVFGKSITADETADWKTYKNEEYGFEVKYPNFIELYTIDNDAVIPIHSYMDICNTLDSMVCLYYFGKPNNHPFAASVTISVPKDANNDDMTEIDCANYNDYSDDFKEMFDISNIDVKEIGGNRYYYFPISDAGLGHSKSMDLYRTFQDNRCFEIGLNIEYLSASDDVAISEEEQKSILSQLDQILSTLRFLE